MVDGKLKSRTLRRVAVRTPGARRITHYRVRKVGRATCPVTGQQLHGLSRGTKSQLRSMPKSSRTVSRAFGGTLSSKASRAKLVQKARLL